MTHDIDQVIRNYCTSISRDRYGKIKTAHPNYLFCKVANLPTNKTYTRAEFIDIYLKLLFKNPDVL